MTETIAALTHIFTLTFVVTSMFTFGLHLTLQQIVEPLRNARLVAAALLVNFVIVPLVAYLLARLFSLSQDLTTGLVLMSAAAGAPMIPKLAQIAHGDIRVAVSLVALLVVATVVYMPLVLPLVLPEVTVNPGSIAVTLGWQIMLPLALGLVLDSLYDEASQILLPVLSPIANISLALMLVTMLASNLRNMMSLLGTGAIVSIVLLVVIGMVAGYFLGGRDGGVRRVVSLSGAQRNLAAAFAVATASFIDRPNVLIFLAAAGLIAMIMVIPVAAQMGKRSREQESAQAASAPGGVVPVPTTGRRSDDREA